MLFLERAEEETTALCGADEKDGIRADGDIWVFNTYFKESNVFFIYLDDSGDEGRNKKLRSAQLELHFHVFFLLIFILLG